MKAGGLMAGTLTLPAALENRLKVALLREGFSFQIHEYAFWRASGHGVHIIFYTKGTILIQGNEEAKTRWNDWISREFGAATQAPSSAKSSSVNTDAELSWPVLGLDESGKGDYFGPLVLAAVMLSDASAKELAALGVADSKTLTDSTIANLVADVERRGMVRTRLIEPTEYNELYARYGNLNLLMVEEYTRLISEFAGSGVAQVILDRFSSSDAQNAVIRKKSPAPILITAKGERFIPVAAASVIARFYYVKWMKDTAEKTGIPIKMGSGSGMKSLFDRMRTENPGLFPTLAKTHFGQNPRPVWNGWKR